MIHRNRCFALFLAPCITALLFLFSTGCSDDMAAPVPAYLRIDSIYLDSTSYDSTGSTRHKIIAAWVYIDDDLQGVYHLPFVAPILETGNHKITIYAGVSENGSSSMYSRYIFYQPISDSVTFHSGDTLFMEPHVRYNEGLLIPDGNGMEDFEDNFNPKLSKTGGGGSFSYLFDPVAYEGNGCGAFLLQPGDQKLEVETGTITVPTGKIGYFIELNYKNDVDLLVNIKTQNTEFLLIGLRPRDYWNKVYLNITETMDLIAPNDFTIIFRVVEDTTLSSQTVLIDNLKLVY